MSTPCLICDDPRHAADDCPNGTGLESERPSDIDMTGLWACTLGNTRVLVGLLEEAEDDDIVMVVPPYGWTDYRGDHHRAYGTYWSSLRRPHASELKELDEAVVRHLVKAEAELQECQALRELLVHAHVLADSLEDDDDVD